MSVRFPPIRQAVAGESTGVVTKSHVEMAEVAFEVVEPVRIEDTDGGAGEIVVESFLGVRCIQTSNTEQQPQEFFVFAVHADDRIGRVLKGFTVLSDDLELSIAARVMSERHDFAGFSSAQTVSFQELRDDGDADAKAESQQFVGDLRPGQVGPENALAVGIARGVWIDDFEEGIIETGEEGERRLSAAPFFLARWSGKGGLAIRSSSKPRWMVLRWHSKSVAM